MRVLKLNAESRAPYQEGIAALERIATYPLGEDSFQIDHGADYFAFFERLGEVDYYVAVEDGRIAAVAAAILREVPLREGERRERVWYLCDLKVHPDYRGRNLPLKMLRHGLFSSSRRSRKGYAISMNPGDASPSRVAKMLNRFRAAPLSLSATIGIFSLDFETVRACRALIERHRGPVTFLSLLGKKDLILGSTREPLRLLHIQFGTCAEQGDASPRDGFTHMLCAPLEDALTGALSSRGVHPSATASVIQHGMSNSDWRFVLTSDI